MWDASVALPPLPNNRILCTFTKLSTDQLRDVNDLVGMLANESPFDVGAFIESFNRPLFHGENCREGRNVCQTSRWRSQQTGRKDNRIAPLLRSAYGRMVGENDTHASPLLPERAP